LDEKMERNNRDRSDFLAGGAGRENQRLSGSGTGTGNEKDENDRDFIRNELANQKETRHVDLLRYFVIFILVCSAAALSTVTYFLIQSSKNDVMMTQYNGAASKVIVSFDKIIEKIGLLNMVGIAATTYGRQNNENDLKNTST
jgi:hypothetical protein